jgi:iron complex transport system substrate-binding protein
MILNSQTSQPYSVLSVLLCLICVGFTGEVAAAVKGPKSTALRVVSLSPSNTELIYAIGAQEHLVGRTNQCDFPPSSVNIPSIGSLFPPDFERIVAQRPDLVFMSDGNAKTRIKLQSLGLRVMVIHPKTIMDIAASMRILGRTLGRSQQAEVVAKQFEQTLRNITATTMSSHTVMYEVWHKPLMIPGAHTFLADIIRRAGGHPLDTHVTGEWPRVDLEWAITTNPNVILTQNPTRMQAYFDSNSPWKHVDAIRKRRVFTVPDENHFVRPGPRVVHAINWLKKIMNSNSGEKTD